MKAFLRITQLLCMPQWRIPLPWLSLWVLLVSLAKSDVNNASWLVRLRSEYYAHLRIYWQGLCYYDMCIPMVVQLPVNLFNTF